MRVAFVHYPHGPEHARLETMPFVLNAVRELAAIGCRLDLFVWEGHSEELDRLADAGIRVVRPPRLLAAMPKRLLSPWYAARYGIWRSFDLVFGVGQIGLWIGRGLARMARCPLVYLNDELPSCWSGNVWSDRERACARHASLIVTPDAGRNAQLLAELGLPPDRPVSTLFNTARVQGPIPDIDWHARLGIDPHKHIVLHAGSLADWAQVPELLATVDRWPEDMVLVLHSRSEAAVARYRRELGHLDRPGQVVWSALPLAEAELHSLIAAALASLCLYRNSGPNIELIGYSAGKLMRSLACGTPVIASALPSLGFVHERGVGVLVKHPAEIAAQLSMLSERRQDYRDRCLEFVAQDAAFDIAWQRFVADLKQATGVELSQPRGALLPRAQGVEP